VATFLNGAGVGEDHEVSWSTERAHQAVQGIDSLIRSKYNERRLKPQYVFRTINLPAEPTAMPTDVLDRYADFERGRWYRGWTKSILPVASFDAKTTEYSLANIMDNSSKISWWLRLRREDAAYVELDDGGKYYPDFVALDTSGVFWLIEGKSDDNAQRPDTLAKKAAAETCIRFVNDDSRFGTWKYLFCIEAAIKNSRGGWDGLVAAARGLAV
jgi:type III restriction enzyme